ncbi:helicase domino isoform X3 [Venturia canescens]|uniref:helicase domino isoform X3 n=1 Tax=Venturia canescens TaxID=32260 RepID=UPI001C9C99DD|nr:helicase domino isoform X3 [Venturia canescens]
MSDKQGAPNLPPLAGGGNNNGTSNPSTTQQTVSLQQVLATAQGLNVLTTGGGQQFVITSQVPGLTQVLSAGGTANATGLQQVGFPRIVNIGGGSQRVIGVASASGSPLSSPNRQTKVVLATSPKLVRTSLGNVFVTPTSQSSINSIVGQAGSTSPSPARKKLRLTETTEKITASDDSALVGNATTVGSATTTTTTTTTTTSTSYRRRIMEHKMKRMRAIREKYAENASELFFLHAGGNMMDFHNWKRRPPTPQYLLFLRQHRLDPEDDDEDLTVPLAPVNNPVNEIVLASCGAPTTIVVPGNPSHNTNPNFNNPTTPITQSNEIKITSIGATPVAVSTTLPAAVAQLSQQGGTPIIPEAPRPQPTETPIAVTTSSTSAVTFATTAANTTIACPNVEQFTVETPTSVTEMKNETTPSTTVVTTTTNVATTTASTPSPQPVVKLVKLPSASSNNLPISESQNNQEQIVEKAKQEAYVMQRIAELQRDGLWSERRLPKVQEPARTKAHWDYLLEEMVWLAADFAQERKWKKAAAKKCARMVQKHFQEKAIQAQKAEKSHELRLKKIAGFMAKEIKTFWTNVEKLVEFKQQTRLEEKRKKALDQHLNFIVGQTEKYSTWLTEGLNKTEGNPSMPVSINSSRISSPVPTSKQHSDDEFEPNQSSEDDEETIAKAEEEMQSVTNHKEEVELLKKESEIPLEDLIKELPPNYLEERDKSLSPSPKESAEEGNDSVVDGDAEFTVASDESSDDENTIMEQEKLEGNTNHQKELDDLKAENEMSIDELMAKYGNMADTSMDVDVESDHESAGDSDKDEMDQQDEKSESESESEDETKEDEEDSQTQSDGETDVGLKSLLEDLSSDNKPDDKNKSGDGEQCENHNEMDDVAALAESIQPKGNTLLTTSVVTKIPFLLKHSLREYQHIGLDWLVTMYERKLNGILADEMGLGKTIQTIALLAHLACEKGNWGPHLIIVPTSVMLNWEMECKKWCPGFKILTYYGTQKERKQKRTGWTKPNAFHICITSYKLVIQDHQSFRRKKWKYLILDEAQNIKNFKSQRWQLLLNFQTQRRLLLTGTPLQNNLMELWSLMHFLMPNVFQSHREFKEWFSNPVTGMIEGNSEYNENIIRRLHKVLRPFLLRRLKTEVEKQLPKKYEHVVMCRLSKRQRYLYDDFMSRAKTKETLASGNLLSVINVLMQLRKVCNHPNLFEVRPTVSPFQMDAIEFVTASLAWSALDYNPFKSVDLAAVNLLLINLEFTTTAFVAHRVKRLKTPRKLIEEIDSLPEPPPRCPSGKIKINVRLSNQTKAPVAPPPPTTPKVKNFTGIVQNPRTPNSPLIKTINNQASPGQGVTLRVAGGQQLQGYSVQLVQHQGSVKAFPVATLAHNPTGSSSTTTTSPGSLNTQRITVGNANIRDGLQRLTTQTVTVKQGDSVQRIAVPSFAQLVQTSTGRHIILTSNQQNTNTGEFVSFPVMTSSGPRLTVLSKSLMGLSTATKVVGSVVTTTTNAGGRLGMRVPSLNVNTSPIQVATALQQQQPQQQQSLRCGIVTRSAQKEPVKVQPKEEPKSEFHIPQLEEERRKRRQSKLQSIADVNERRCAACPLYGEDLFTALRIEKPATVCQWHNGSLHCKNAKETARTRKQFFSRTEALAAAIKSTEEIVEELKDVFQRFVVYVPAVRAPTPRFHVSHPSPHKFWSQQRVRLALETEFSRKMEIVHPVASAMMTQFPDPRLIQYDCGKLQSLDRLLRNLKADNHRVLIFTQMTRMLDVLEAFLNFHGHIYLRLDGTTKVDQRQVLMERFNGDKRIFCFILSTRSGGVGVNLTGADTVIFYDSDWNPTMDAQAQDRCHRIGQTRDVHIYRLVSDRTVEENILKKANQKRLLGDLAIEGGNFTTAYFKSSTIQDLFNVDQTENDASTRMADVLDQNRDRDKALHREATVASASSQPTEEKVAIGALESALAAAEEELDVQAAKTAKAEAVADLAEFDENIPLDETERDDPQFSKAEQEVQNLVSQLTPVERYAMKFVEEAEGSFSAAQLAAAERELEQQKKEWELDRLRALREEEERRLRLADDDEKPLTFGREDAQNQVNNTSNNKRVGVRKRACPEANRGGSGRMMENARIGVSAKRRGSLRGCNNKRRTRVREQSITESEEEDDTTTDSDDSEESQDDDLVEDSPDEESSHTESQSQGDEEEEEEEAEDEDEVENDDNDDEDEEGDEDEEFRDTRNSIDRGGTRGNANFPKRRNRLNKSSERNNRWDINSPRTRSRGNVKINLWALDVSPILPGAKPTFRNNRKFVARGRKKSDRSKSDDGFVLPMSPLSPKKNIHSLSSSTVEKAAKIADEKSTEEEDDDDQSAQTWPTKRKNSANENFGDESANDNNQMTSSPVVTVSKMANVEILIAEKMSEMSSSMEMSQSDESAEHERSCAFSSDSRSNEEEDSYDVASAVGQLKATTNNFPRVEIAVTDFSIGNQENEKETVPLSEITKTGRTRSKPGLKRLTQTFDASFDESGVNSKFESESLIAGTTNKSGILHVTRSTHKSCTTFGKSVNDEETTNSEINSNLKISSPEMSHEESQLNESTESEAAAITNSNSSVTKRSTISLTRASRRSNAKSVTPDRDKASAGLDCPVESNVEASQKTRNVAKRSQSKIQLEDVATETCPEKVENPTKGNDENDLKNENVQSEIENKEIIVDNETMNKNVKPNSAEADKSISSQVDKKIILSSFVFSNPSIGLCDKLNAEPRVHLRRPDTPLPGVVTRRTKPTSGSEASTSGSSNETEAKLSSLQIRKSLEGRRSTRLSSGLSSESQDLELAMQNIIKCEAKVVLIKRPEIPSGEQLKMKKPAISSSSVVNASSLMTSHLTANSPKIVVKKLDTRVTRSSLSSNPDNVKTNVSSSVNDRPTTRRSRPSLDNGFLVPQAIPRRIKSPGGGASENVSQPTIRLNRKFTNETVQQATSVSSFPMSQKRRPDTPLPSIDSPTRVTRSRADVNSQNSIVPKTKNLRRNSTNNESITGLSRSISPPGCLVKQGDANDTDSNGNAVAHESSIGKITTDQNSSASHFENEKPQRTAKVVAILTLESRGNNHRGPTPTSPVKKSTDDNETKCTIISSSSNASSIDVDSESESETFVNDSNSTRKISARKNIKRTRMSIGKSLISDDSDEQFLDIVDESKDDDSPIQPTRKLVKLHSAATSIDKFNSTAS